MTGGSRAGLNASFRKMWLAPAVALAAAVAVTIAAPTVRFAALPILLLWTASPAIAWWISRPLTQRAARADEWTESLLARSRAPHMGVLRDLRRP